ncbi:MAG TPA: enoyl-CoA hydratase [Spongiibacteraceae bacterium]|nr:enoyl-CoA hydratase [Spongiibacteraceae bacterium]HCS28889.1 enoyl-CoA hydratase [Spongiibacteraceae bacterium]|tara:strand:+ start:388 stop:1203 length:816 start_codon:yes stop_codon:yes gene_type:complete
MNTITIEQLDDGIQCINLNRPDSLNALNEALIGDLLEAFTALNNDRKTRVVILTGAGKGFCAGADLKNSSAGPGTIPGTDGMGQLGYTYKFQEYLAELMLAIHECDKPVIAAVNGAAVGGGLALTLACDIRIASTAARFGSVFIKTGLSSCDVGTSYFLPRLVGASDAAELMLTGRIFDAEEAKTLRLTSQTVAPEQLLESALEKARMIAANAEYGVWMTKKGLRSNIDAPGLRQAMELENRTQVLGCFTGCMEEAMQAFQEKRAPQWPGL